MGKPRAANGRDNNTRHTVRLVAKILATGEPTIFRWESWCRYTIRGTLCLQGVRWGRADARAADVVRRALELLNVQRPPWAWGQREYVFDSAGTRIGYSHCLQCGTKLPEGRLKFCASSCGDQYRQVFQNGALRARARERALASLKARRDAAAPQQCESCGVWFRSAKPEQRFCSRQCSGGRSVAEKMNGKHHPWVNGNGRIGAGDASTAAHSSPIPPTNGNGSAMPNARAMVTPPSFDGSAPRPAPN